MPVFFESFDFDGVFHIFQTKPNQTKPNQTKPNQTTSKILFEYRYLRRAIFE
jgi:hypothetical protein